MRSILFGLLLIAPAAIAQSPSREPRAVVATELGCVTPELRAAAFQAVDAQEAPTFRQAMHHCVITGGVGKQAPRRT